MKKIFSFIAFIMLLGIAGAQELRSFEKDGLYGFKKGEKIIIPATYEYASEFYGNIALVKAKGLWGYIDRENHYLIQPQYEQAEPMIDGIARVFRAGKMGMIDSTGKLIIPIEFDRFEEGYNGLELYKGDTQGLLTRDGNFIPAIYTKISRTNKFVVGSKDQKHDIYYAGKLLFEGSESSPVLLRIYSTDIVDVYKNGKAAILTKEGKFLTDHLYSKVQTFTTSLYPESQPDLHYNYMIALDRSYIQYPENGDPDLAESITAFEIMRADGSMLSDQPFDQVFTDNYINEYDENEVKLKQNGHFATISPEGELIVSPYTDIVYYQTIQIRYKEGKKADICSYYEPSTLIRSFNYVDIPQYYSVFYDEMTGEATGTTSNSSYGEVIVSNDPAATEITGLKALYDVVYRQFITEETDTLPTITGCGYFGDSKYYILLKDGYFNLWYEGQAPIKHYPYEAVEHIGGDYFLLRDQDGKSFVKNLATGKQTPIGTAIATFSETMYTQNNYDDTYNPDGYYPEPTLRYYSKFVHLTDTVTGMVGFIWDQAYFKPQFDDLVQDPTEYPLQILHPSMDGKWGAYFLTTNNFVEPQFDSIPVFRVLEGTNTLAYSDFSEKGGFYMDVKGRKWPFLPYDVYPDGQKNKMGLIAYDVFAEDEKPVHITPSVFRSIESVEVELSFIVQNNKKKFGILNPFGDTLVPLQYSSIQYAELYSTDGFSLFSLKKDKKFGLYQSGTFRIIPAVYDKIETLFTQLGNPLGYLVHSGDLVGLYDMNFNLLLPCEYNGIAVNYSNEIGYQFFILKGDKMATVHTYNPERSLAALMGTAKWYDRIAGTYGYVLKEDKWEKFNHETGQYFDASTRPEDVSYLDYYSLFFENNLIGIRDLEGTILNKADMKFVVFMDGETMYTFKGGYIYNTYIGSEESFIRNEW